MLVECFAKIATHVAEDVSMILTSFSEVVSPQPCLSFSAKTRDSQLYFRIWAVTASLDLAPRQLKEAHVALDRSNRAPWLKPCSDSS